MTALESCDHCGDELTEYEAVDHDGLILCSPCSAAFDQIVCAACCEPFDDGEPELPRPDPSYPSRTLIYHEVCAERYDRKYATTRS